MTTWSSNELQKIGAGEELEIAPAQGDGTLRKPIPIWVVRVDDNLYIRSYKGVDSAWFRAAQATREGWIRAGGVEKNVTFLDIANPDSNRQIDAAYTDKYSRRYPGIVPDMVTPEVQATTMKIVPHSADT